MWDKSTLCPYLTGTFHCTSASLQFSVGIGSCHIICWKNSFYQFFYLLTTPCFLIRFPWLRQLYVQNSWPDWIILTVSSFSLLSSFKSLSVQPPVFSSPTTPSLSRFGHRSLHVMAERVSLCLAHTSSLSQTAGTQWNKRLNKGFGASKTAANSSPSSIHAFPDSLFNHILWAVV